MGAVLTTFGVIAAKPRTSGIILLCEEMFMVGQAVLQPKLPPNYAANVLQGSVTIPFMGCIHKDIFAIRDKHARTIKATITPGLAP
jgi:hypothetical protein